MSHFPLMARFNAWANARIYDSVARLPDAAYRADCKAFFGSIHGTLNHLLLVDRLWGGRIEGVDRGIRTLDEILYEDFSALREARTNEDKRLIDLVDSLDEAQLEKPIPYRRIIGDGMEEARAGHMLITLFNHQTHHRGQVHVLLTQADIVPAALDVIFFLDEVGECVPTGMRGT
ncbi:MAG: DinB family protein [Alphaproteobacteria bacterium]